MQQCSNPLDGQKQRTVHKELSAFCREVRQNAHNLDQDGAFPEQEIAGLKNLGFLHAPLPIEHGGIGLTLDAQALFRILSMIGSASLSLGRLYEGHVNAIGLVVLYGEPHHLGQLRREADAGRLTGVWNAQDNVGVRLAETPDGFKMAGRKIWASGAAHIQLPLVTATRSSDDAVFMVLPRLNGSGLTDVSAWRAHGMRASETGVVDFAEAPIHPSQIVGRPGDYYRSPHFSGGAWRVLAVQLGAMRQLFAEFRHQLGPTPRACAEHYRTLLGRAAIALETAELWVSEASKRISQAGHSADVDAYVNLARTAFERSALDLIEHVQRGLGLNAFIRNNAVERLARDLLTYLRQPFPDKALSQAIDRLLDDGSQVLNESGRE